MLRARISRGSSLSQQDENGKVVKRHRNMNRHNPLEKVHVELNTDVMTFTFHRKREREGITDEKKVRTPLQLNLVYSQLFETESMHSRRTVPSRNLCIYHNSLNISPTPSPTKPAYSLNKIPVNTASPSPSAHWPACLRRSRHPAFWCSSNSCQCLASVFFSR